jgi:hypothetical protein
MLCIEAEPTQEIVAYHLLLEYMRTGGKMAKTAGRTKSETTGIPARIAEKSVFEVNSGRLGIAEFSRPLLEKEMRRFRAAWEESLPVGMEASEVDLRRISFVAHPDGLPAAWDRIDSLLAAATGKSGKSGRSRKVA